MYSLAGPPARFVLWNCYRRSNHNIHQLFRKTLSTSSMALHGFTKFSTDSVHEQGQRRLRARLEQHGLRAGKDGADSRAQSRLACRLCEQGSDAQ
jgi:hypothetical protein